jgi:NADH:ubiquinone oxidoreductase subunit E
MNTLIRTEVIWEAFEDLNDDEPSPAHIIAESLHVPLDDVSAVIWDDPDFADAFEPLACQHAGCKITGIDTCDLTGIEAVDPGRNEVDNEIAALYSAASGMYCTQHAVEAVGQAMGVPVADVSSVVLLP